VGLRDWLVRHGRISATASRPDPAAQPARAFVRTVRITLAEQVGGCRQEVDVAWVATCGDCAGSGRRHAHAHACEECTGTGRSFASGVSEPCLACGSTGAAPAPRCVACGGTGRIGRREKRTVAIPAGLRAGSLLPVAAGAPAADAGEPAALQLRIEFADDPQFRIDRFPDLAVELPVDAVVAGRGGRVQVPTLAGTRWIDVPAGVVDGTSLRLPAEGLADGAGARGVLVARVRLVRTVRDADVHAHADARSSCAHDAAARPRERPRSDASLRVS
jgi:DnaJ-class molecular chaperone